MVCEKLFEKIDGLYEEHLDIWETVLNMESPTMDKQRVDAVGEYFIDIAKKNGWATEVFESVTGNVVCITMNPDADKPAVTLSGHIDTVHPVGSCGTPAARRDGENIYGPGAIDCKGGLISALLAMEALKQCGFTSRPVRFLLQSDEEAGSRPINKPTIRYICEKSLGSVAFFNLEPGKMGETCIQRKGIVTFTVKVTGVEAHSSICASKGANAIAEAAHKILKLEEFKDADGITCCCGVISGGKTHNTVPGYCEFRANFRFVNESDYKYITEFMQELAKMVYIEGCTTEVEEYGYRPPMERVDRNLKLLETANKIFSENELQTLKPVSISGGSDAAQVTSYGIPCLDKLGVCGGYGHNPNEYATLESLKYSAKMLASFIYCI